jgi:hypothetical protein
MLEARISFFHSLIESKPKISVINTRHKKAAYGKIHEIMNDWNCDTTCTLTSLPASNVENFKRVIFAAHGVNDYLGLEIKRYSV